MPRRLSRPSRSRLMLVAGLAILASAGWLVPGRGAAESPSSPRSATATGPARVPMAAVHFGRLCARCHDEDLTGKEKRSRGLAVPDFTSRAWHERRSDAQLLVAILDGRGTDMPSFGD